LAEKVIDMTPPANERAMKWTGLDEVWFIAVMIKVTVSMRRGLDKGEAADGRSDALMDMAMEMAIVVMSIVTEAAGEDRVVPRDRNDNGEQSSMSEFPATTWALGDWRICMECVAQQQTHKLAQLHRTIAQMANML
jgi:hypothetical protein